MKKRYTIPEVEIIQFDLEACITMSGGDTIGDNDINLEDTGWE